MLDSGPKRVFEELEEHMAQVIRNVGEGKILLRCKELYLWGTLDGVAIVSLAKALRFGSTRLRNAQDIGPWIDDADVAISWRLIQGNELPKQHSNADARHEEAVEEDLYFVSDLAPLVRCFPLEYAAGYMQR